MVGGRTGVSESFKAEELCFTHCWAVITAGIHMNNLLEPNADSFIYYFLSFLNSYRSALIKGKDIKV